MKLVSEVLLSAAGYDSREEARQSLYRKARLLYDFDFEGDRIAIIQSLLLMSHYYPSMTEKKHTWHWVHQAISMAQVASLHRNHGESSDRNLHARIWWGCLVRDRMNSLGTSRPMVINSLDCNVPMLTIDDLHEPGDDEDQLAVKAMYIEFLKLCQYMEGVLSLRHDIVFVEGRPPDQVKVCDETLQLWLENLPHVAMRQEPNMADDGGVQISALYRAVLHSAYKYVYSCYEE
ncbi:cutinase transcription factor 1 beta [Penicillium fimorum]|uniref:Cutinase transcription factor 1 beta n=1 Tax=Penicillium fimorum TaxID=1882269 RepID=A0A9W9Y879_9EURO|nr:cutinase transcription factor 1 beta [Penicillium fimorum]